MRCAILLVMLLGLALGGAPGQTSDIKMPGHTFQGLELSGNFIVKFDERAVVRLQDGALVSRAGRDLGSFLEALQGFPRVRIARLFTRSEAELDADRREARARTGEAMPDLNSYFLLRFDGPVDWPRLVDALNALSIVAIAYPESRGVEPAVALTPTLLLTPDYTHLQGYRGAPPAGIHAIYGNRFPGGLAKGIQIIDFERGWIHNHEDLGGPSHLFGTLRSGSRDHGAAVLGEMIGVDNGFGVTGIAHGVTAATVSYYQNVLSTSLNQAVGYSKAGDFILLEVQISGPGGYAPVEWDTATFDVIKIATGKGIHVFEAAGNGYQNLDDSKFLGRFDRTKFDSGAVMCAASNGDRLDPASFTNYGSRIDAHGWGYNVATCGYGTLYQGSGEHQYYTQTFSGTSSASPIVTGAGLVIEGVSRALTGQGLSPKALRDIITATGTPQNPNAKRIGPRPDLKRALSRVGAHLSSDGLAWPGRKIALDLVDVVSPGLPYRAAASLGSKPGIVLSDRRVIPLNPDPLLYISLLGLTNLFAGFDGQLDSQGYATAGVEILNESFMVGVTIHLAFVVIDFNAPAAIRTISNPWAISVTKKS